MPAKENIEITYKGTDFSERDLSDTIFELCHFDSCNFSGLALYNTQFTECSFTNCDFSGAQLPQTSFQQVAFKSCKLMGLRFADCKQLLLEMQFDACLLDFSTFYQLPLKATRFTDCSLKEADFGEADLSKTVFKNCDLQGALFERTKLDAADLTTARAFIIDPEINSLKKARFSRHNLDGLLTKYDIVIE